MMFEFATATRVVVGAGSISRIGGLAADFGRRALVVTGRTPGRAQAVVDGLRAHHLGASMFAVAGEPDIDAVRRGVRQASADACDVVIGIGGGSALDAAKAIAVMVSQPGDVLDYLEVVGRGTPLAHGGLPCVAIPTTAGTGSEVTRNAVLASPAHRVKASLRGPQVFPRLALVDPDLTCGLPPDVRAFTGLDALTQLIEPYLSSRANPLTDALCTDGIRRAARSLPRVVDAAGADRAAREDMAVASLLSGMALTNAGLGAVHGFAAVIGGMFAAPHGALCAALLPHVMLGNWRALQARAAVATTAQRFEDVARLLTGRVSATAAEGIAWLEGTVAAMRIPALRAYGVTAADLDEIAARAARASSMKANPVELTAGELRAVLSAAL